MIAAAMKKPVDQRRMLFPLLQRAPQKLRQMEHFNIRTGFAQTERELN